MNDGFQIDGRMHHVTVAGEEAFLDRMIGWVEKHGLAMGGGCGRRCLDVFITSATSKSCDADDQKAMAEFLRSDPDVASFRIGPLADAEV